MTGKTLSAEGVNLLFTQARTHAHWQDREIPDALLRQAYDLARMGPTSANCQPLRIVFLRKGPLREKLRPALMEGNVEKTMAAPVVAILANDSRFYEHLPRLFPHADARSWFEGNAPLIAETAMRNGSMQAAYFIMAARALGLDCGPMSGFDKAAVDRTFFSDGRFQSNMLCNLGYGDAGKLYPRNPRLGFDEACSLL